jgi:hypothetical protein
LNIGEDVGKLAFAPGWNCICSIELSLTVHLVRFPVSHCSIRKNIDDDQTQAIEYVFKYLEKAITVLEYLFDKYHSLET